MDIHIQDVDGVELIQVSGRVDSETAPALREIFNQVLDRQTSLILELSSVEYINSAGLREIVAAFKHARSEGGDLRLSGLSDRVQEVFDVSGLAALFAIYADSEAARDSYN